MSYISHSKYRLKKSMYILKTFDHRLKNNEPKILGKQSTCCLLIQIILLILTYLLITLASSNTTIFLS